MGVRMRENAPPRRAQVLRDDFNGLEAAARCLGVNAEQVWSSGESSCGRLVSRGVVVW